MNEDLENENSESSTIVEEKGLPTFNTDIPIPEVKPPKDIPVQTDD